jgi:hypothetical protein
MLCCGERLAWVAGLGVDAAFACAAGEEGVELLWERSDGQAPAGLALPEKWPACVGPVKG